MGKDNKLSQRKIFRNDGILFGGECKIKEERMLELIK